MRFSRSKKNKSYGESPPQPQPPGKIMIAGIQAQGVHDAVTQINRAADLGYTAALVDTHHGERT